ncbi:hypothetical protein D9615_000942 [Tricholomella constricta]|uniref:Small nuclear ribonucleoprotein Prp3 C-terminal domain-containing protein n=1 Tax=Tricholomella constricta TaxID=117010 RepID=A0A8H5M8P0_9AGAR|nr:hypothetical protein D9615_000942 [Tricholomella constricta]
MGPFPPTKQLDELQLIRCSLLPDESLLILDDNETWTRLITAHSEEDADALAEHRNLISPARVEIKVKSARVFFVIELPLRYAGSLAETTPTFAVKGDQITRVEQHQWQRFIEEKLEEIAETEYPIYQLITLHLLPLVHEELEAWPSQTPVDETDTKPASPSPRYHALLTSHHLISPNKRRSLQNWSTSLSLSGFAKVGYPGVIYAEGQKEEVEEFVGYVKAMQWLALRVRFVEELPEYETSSSDHDRRWMECQKVSEVVEEMRRLGREQLVVEMGIGSAGSR